MILYEFASAKSRDYIKYQSVKALDDKKNECGKPLAIEGRAAKLGGEESEERKLCGGERGYPVA